MDAEYGVPRMDPVMKQIRSLCHKIDVPFRIFYPTGIYAEPEEQTEFEKQWEQYGRDLAEYIECRILELPIPERLRRFMPADDQADIPIIVEDRP